MAAGDPVVRIACRPGRDRESIRHCNISTAPAGGSIVKQFYFCCLTVLFLFSIEGCSTSEREAQSPMKPSTFGVLADGREVLEYTLANKSGMSARIINYGDHVIVRSGPERQQPGCGAGL